MSARGLLPRTSVARYRVGCAGMFVLGTDMGYDDVDAALAACESPPGAYVVDRVTGECFMPMSWEEIEEAKARVAERAVATERSEEGTNDG
jgi:hypothetical protein